MKLVASAWITIAALLLIVVFYPIGYRLLRIFVAYAIPALWLGAWFLTRTRPWLSRTIMLFGLAGMAMLFLPGRDVDVQKLRQLYVRQLRSYHDTRYLWGGEGRLGIDCSGLVRRGLVNANLELGITTLNPNPIRKALDLWWHDCTARDLRDQHRHFTTPLFQAPSINAITNAALKPGDLAVTADGIHVLAYLGDNAWIEADPLVARVIELTVPANNAWFAVPVQVMRWNCLR